ncbi:hypothetical protein [Lentzea fradiae]|nr:hypothetical protein [Lentzea fradiae]
MNPRSGRTALRRKLMELALGELASVVVFFVVLFAALDAPATPANALGYAATAFPLIVGASYWALKWRRLAVPGPALPGAAIFRVARVLGVLLIAGGLVASAWQLAVEPGLGVYPGLVLTVFGAVEHVNYFHRQISPAGRPWTTVLKPGSWPRSHLARDLRRR